MGGNTSKVTITAQDKSILDLKLQRDRLRQYQRRIEGIAAQEQAIAKDALAAGNKTKALAALRRRKYQDSLLTKTDAQLETLQNLVSSIEFALVEKDVLFGLEQGNAVLKEIHKEMNLENVDRLMGDTADSIAYQKEINETMASRMSADEEEEVQAELAALQKAELESHLPDAPREPARLPDVPTAPIGSEVDREEQGERAQEARLAIPA